MQDIKIEHLSKSYGDKRVIDDYCDTIKAGKVNFITAHSGAGKTTLLRIIMGLESADSGKIIMDSDVKISAVFQEDRLCNQLDAVSNIRLVNPNLSRHEVVKKLEEFGLKDIDDKKTEKLSGGMKRRVAILRALLADFDVIFLDEPFQGLDIDTKINVINHMKRYISGKTAVMITHEPEDIKFFDSNILKFSV